MKQESINKIIKYIYWLVVAFVAFVSSVIASLIILESLSGLFATSGEANFNIAVLLSTLLTPILIYLLQNKLTTLLEKITVKLNIKQIRFNNLFIGALLWFLAYSLYFSYAKDTCSSYKKLIGCKSIWGTPTLDSFILATIITVLLSFIWSATRKKR